MTFPFSLWSKCFKCDPSGATKVKVFTAGCKVMERSSWETDKHVLFSI